MKLNSFILVTAIVLTACQKESNDNQPAANPQNKPTPVVNPKTTYTSLCTTKEVIKYISETDGRVTRETNEETVKSVSVSTLTAQKDNKRSSDISGEFVIEGFTTGDDGVKKPSTKADYTYTGNRVTSYTKIDDKTAEQALNSDVLKTGRNGYQFTNKDNTKSDTQKVVSEFKMTMFDDGEMSYYTKYDGTVNGNKANVLIDTVEHYKTVGNVTTSVFTLRTPRVVKNAAGVVIQETESYEENCTATKE